MGVEVAVHLGRDALFFFVDFFFVALRLFLHQRVDFAIHVAQDLNHVRHDPVGETLQPGLLHNDIRGQQVVARAQARCEAFLVALVDEKVEEFVDERGVAALRRDFHGILHQPVTFAKFNRLLPARVALVDVRRNSTELNQLMAFALNSERDLVTVIIHVERGLQRRVILFFNSKFIHRIVHRSQVRALHS